MLRIRNTLAAVTHAAIVVALATSCSDDPWETVADKDNYCIEQWDESGNLILREQKVDGDYNGYYRVNHVGPYLVNCEGWYDMGVKVGEWKSWYDNGQLQYEEHYAPTASVKRVSRAVVIREATLLSSRDYDVAGNLVGVTRNGVGVRVKMDLSYPFRIVGFETSGFATNYVVSYGNTSSTRFRQDETRLSGIMLTEEYQDGEDRILENISWSWAGDGSRLSWVSASMPRCRRHVEFDDKGEVDEVVEEEGETPKFLLGVPVIVPILSSNKLVFCEKVQYDDGHITIKRIPRVEGETLQLW